MDTEAPVWTEEMFDALNAPVPNPDQIIPPPDPTSSLWFCEIITILRIISFLPSFKLRLNLTYTFLDLQEAAMSKHKETYKNRQQHDDLRILEDGIARGETALFSRFIHFS
jgi:hypothetical protein